ncbi:MAG TPA: AAA family ATPase [Usitatibacter sp.]|nr:AAA family ATPase [Usitatibacter sp.]
MTMYLEHFGLREAPFRITPHTEFFFSGANRGATLEALLYAITAGEGMVKVTGEVGSGKTMLCRVLMERLPETVETIYLAVPSLTRDEMLAAIAEDLGLETTGANTTKLIRMLQEKLIEVHASGKQVVCLIDEAHAMPLATLEEVRLLSNLETGTEKLLQLVLFGQPELDQHLALPNMRQLRERITHSFTLLPLPPREIRDYVNFRLRAAGYHGPDLFDAEVLGIIGDASEGLTRRINIFSDKTLLAAFAAGTHTVTADHARAAISDTQIVVMKRESPRRLAFAAAAGIGVGTVLGFLLAHVVAPATAPQANAAPAAHAMPAPADPPPAAPAPGPAAPAASATTVSPPAGMPIPAAAPDAARRSAPPAARAANPPVPDTAAAVDARLAAGRELIAAPSNRFAVQLMVADARERGYIENYLSEAGRTVQPERLYLVPAGSPDAPRVGVIVGTFDERNAAMVALASLPENLRQFRPYVRSLDDVREDALKAERK